MKKKTGILALTIAFLVLCATPASAVILNGACVRITIGASAADTSIAELEAVSSGNGIYLTFIVSGITTVATNIGLTISSTTFIDETSAVVTPDFTFGNTALTTIIRHGRDDSGALPGEGDFLFPVMGAPIPVSFSTPFFIPAGSFLSVRPIAVNTLVDVTLCFHESP